MKENPLTTNHTDSEGYENLGDPTSIYYMRKNTESKSSIDYTPTRATILIGVTFVSVWVGLHILSFFNFGTYAEYVRMFGVVPSDPQYYTYITSVFMHGSFVHLFVNLIAFVSFGGLLHRKLESTSKFVGYFMVTGIVSLYAQVLAFSAAGIGTDIPLIGASGAICAIFGYFGFAKPNEPVVLFYIIKVKAKNALTIFSAISVLLVAYFGFGAGGIAHTAHIVGLGMGMATGIRFGDVPNKIPILDSSPLSPFITIMRALRHIVVKTCTKISKSIF